MRLLNIFFSSYIVAHLSKVVESCHKWTKVVTSCHRFRFVNSFKMPIYHFIHNIKNLDFNALIFLKSISFKVKRSLTSKNEVSPWILSTPSLLLMTHIFLNIVYVVSHKTCNSMMTNEVNSENLVTLYSLRKIFPRTDL